MTDDAAATPLTGSIIAHYRLLAPLGMGGMGAVWEAEDLQLPGRRVAIKLLPPELVRDPVRRTMFRAEARTALEINHPNVVRVYELGSDHGHEFLVMERVDGRSLQVRLLDGPLELSETVHLGIQIARGMAAAHAQGVLHRDLKPSNVLVTPTGIVRIIDFGLAALTARSPSAAQGEDPTRSRLHTWLDVLHDPSLPVAVQRDTAQGTLPYMSPEQLRGLPLDEHTDIFSLGVLLYEMSTGRRPFGATSTADLIRQVLEARPIPIRTLMPNIAPGFEQVVARAMAEMARDRYASMEALAVALEDPETLRPSRLVLRLVESVTRASRLLLRRRRLPVVVGCTVLGLLAAGLPALDRAWFARRYFRADFSAPDKSTLLAAGWKLIEPDLDLWNRPDSSGCVTLFTHRADNWCPKEMHYPIHNILAHPFTRHSFIATTCLVGFHPHHNYQQAGLVLLGDEDNYVRLDYAWSDGQTLVQAVFEVHGQTQPFQIMLPQSERVWLQIERDGDRFVARARLDEEQRPFVQVAERRMDFQQDYIGLAAFHGINADLPDGKKQPFLWDPLPAHFDALVVEARR